MTTPEQIKEQLDPDTQFDGSGDGINLVPQHWQLNRGETPVGMQWKWNGLRL